MKKEILRKYFHGLTDEQFEEKVSNYPLNNVFGAMDEYAQAKAGQHETIVSVPSTERDYYDCLEKVCNELIDEVEKGNVPKHQFNGLKILLNRPAH